jgi:hypothetical protein
MAARTARWSSHVRDETPVYFGRNALVNVDGKFTCPDWNFPKNSNADDARRSRWRLFEDCAATGALVFPGHAGAPFAGYIEKSGLSFRPRFQAN